MVASIKFLCDMYVFLGAVYRYYESTRQKHLDDQPGRLAAKERNQRNTKIRNRQKQVVIFVYTYKYFRRIVSLAI